MDDCHLTLDGEKFTSALNTLRTVRTHAYIGTSLMEVRFTSTVNSQLPAINGEANGSSIM
jgi:hypothetical protein